MLFSDFLNVLQTEMYTHTCIMHNIVVMMVVSLLGEKIIHKYKSQNVVQHLWLEMVAPSWTSIDIRCPERVEMFKSKVCNGKGLCEEDTCTCSLNRKVSLFCINLHFR